MCGIGYARTTRRSIATLLRALLVKVALVGYTWTFEMATLVIMNLEFNMKIPKIFGTVLVNVLTKDNLKSKSTVVAAVTGSVGIAAFSPPATEIDYIMIAVISVISAVGIAYKERKAK